MQNTNNHYLITLQPTTAFFFGGEQTFDSGAEKNYSVQSNAFPQQTALLGMLRHSILRQHDLLGKRHEWKTWIGPESFTLSKEKTTAWDFGKIKSISPVFLSKKEANKPTYYYTPQSFDFRIDEGNASLNCLTYTPRSGKGQAQTTRNLAAIPQLKDFNPKHEQADLLVRNDGECLHYLEKKDNFNIIVNKNNTIMLKNGFFSADTRVGIRKDYDGSSHQDAFYRQTYFKLAEGVSFAFFATLERDCTLTNGLMPLGGEQSMFSISIEKTDKTYTTLFPKTVFSHAEAQKAKMLILTSDALIDADAYPFSSFALAQIRPFRQIITPQNVSNFSNLTQYSKQNAQQKDKNTLQTLYKSQRWYLLKRGSVFYEPTPALEDLFKNSYLKNIGYNHYFTY